MLDVNKVEKVYISCGFIDFRKQIDGLAFYVMNELKLDLYQNAIFVFCNKGRDKIKILHFDNGFWLYLYILEHGKFKWPQNSGDIETNIEELRWILQGYELRNGRKFKEVVERKLC